MRKFVELEEEISVWGKKNDVHPSVLGMIKHVPDPPANVLYGPQEEDEKEKDEEIKEFYIKINGIIPNKSYIPASKEQKLIDWLKLTHELFFCGL